MIFNNNEYLKKRIEKHMSNTDAEYKDDSRINKTSLKLLRNLSNSLNENKNILIKILQNDKNLTSEEQREISLKLKENNEIKEKIDKMIETNHISLIELITKVWSYSFGVYYLGKILISYGHFSIKGTTIQNSLNIAIGALSKMKILSTSAFLNKVLPFSIVLSLFFLLGIFINKINMLLYAKVYNSTKRENPQKVIKILKDVEKFERKILNYTNKKSINRYIK